MIPTFPGPDLTYKVGVLWTSLTRYHSDNGFFEPSSARAGHHSLPAAGRHEGDENLKLQKPSNFNKL